MRKKLSLDFIGSNIKTGDKWIVAVTLTVSKKMT